MPRWIASPRVWARGDFYEKEGRLGQSVEFDAVCSPSNELYALLIPEIEIRASYDLRNIVIGVGQGSTLQPRQVRPRQVWITSEDGAFPSAGPRRPIEYLRDDDYRTRESHQVVRWIVETMQNYETPYLYVELDAQAQESRGQESSAFVLPLDGFDELVTKLPCWEQSDETPTLTPTPTAMPRPGQWHAYKFHVVRQYDDVRLYRTGKEAQGVRSLGFDYEEEGLTAHFRVICSGSGLSASLYTDKRIEVGAGITSVIAAVGNTRRVLTEQDYARSSRQEWFAFDYYALAGESLEVTRWIIETMQRYETPFLYVKIDAQAHEGPAFVWPLDGFDELVTKLPCWEQSDG